MSPHLKTKYHSPEQLQNSIKYYAVRLRVVTRIFRLFALLLKMK